MTIKDLSQLYRLNKEIAQYEARLAVLYAKAEGMTGAVTGTPRTTDTADPVGRYAVEIAPLREKLENAKRRRVEALAILLRYIHAIPGRQMRRIFRLRFVDGLSWVTLAERVGSTPGSVKRRVFREITKRGVF